MTSKYSWIVGRGLWDSLFGSYFMRDDVSDSQTVIDFAHHEIHEGDHYWTNISGTNISGAALRLKVTTPDTAKWLHITSFGVSSGESIFTITEAPSGGATGGSVISPTNRNRNSSDTSGAVVTKGVTAPTGGLVMGGEPENHGFDKDKISGETRSDSEIMLKQDTTYVFELESSTSDIVGNLLLDWYEHTNSN